MKGLLITPTGITNMRGRPCPGFLLTCTIANRGELPIALLNLTFEVHLANPHIQVQPRRAALDGLSPPTKLSPKDPQDIHLPIEMGRDALGAIEEKRSHDSDVDFLLHSNALVAPIMMSGSGPDAIQFMGVPEYVFVECEHPEGFLRGFRLSRDRWREILKTFGYSELELFELPVPAALDGKLRIEVLGALRKAEQAFRSGDWDGTLANSHSAFEALATGVAESPNTAEGFSQLWPRVFQEHEQAKAPPLDQVVRNLRDFQQLGRHLKHPYVPVSRLDALLALRLTLALFEYIGHRLR